MSNDVERAEEKAKRQRQAADRETSELLRMAVVGILVLIVFLAVLIAAKLRWSSTDFGRLEVPLRLPQALVLDDFVNGTRPGSAASSVVTDSLVEGSRVTHWLAGRDGPVGTRLPPRA